MVQHQLFGAITREMNEALEQSIEQVTASIDPIEVMGRSISETALQVNYFTEGMRTAGSVVTSATETITLFAEAAQALTAYGEDAVQIAAQLESHAQMSQFYFGGGRTPVQVGEMIEAETAEQGGQKWYQSDFARQLGSAVYGALEGGGDWRGAMKAALPLILVL